MMRYDLNTDRWSIYILLTLSIKRRIKLLFTGGGALTALDPAGTLSGPSGITNSTKPAERRPYTILRIWKSLIELA